MVVFQQDFKRNIWCEVWLGAASSATINRQMYALATNSSDSGMTAEHDDHFSIATNASEKQSSYY